MTEIIFVAFRIYFIIVDTVGVWSYIFCDASYR